MSTLKLHIKPSCTFIGVTIHIQQFCMQSATRKLYDKNIFSYNVYLENSSNLKSICKLALGHSQLHIRMIRSRLRRNFIEIACEILFIVLYIIKQSPNCLSWVQILKSKTVKNPTEIACTYMGDGRFKRTWFKKCINTKIHLPKTEAYQLLL